MCSSTPLFQLSTLFVLIFVRRNFRELKKVAKSKPRQKNPGEIYTREI